MENAAGGRLDQAGRAVGDLAAEDLAARAGGAEVKGALISVELALGFWFVSGYGVRASRWVAIALFATFAAASSSAAFAGAASCDCLGAVKANPRVVLAFDVLVVLILLAVRFKGPWGASDRLAGRIALGTFALSAAGIVLASAMFGSWFNASAQRDNQPLFIDPVAASVGDCRPGEPVATTVIFFNRSDKPIQIIVAQSDCSCITADVPAWVAPGEARGVRVEVRPPMEAGPFVRKIGWLTTVGSRSGELRGVVVVSRP